MSLLRSWTALILFVGISTVYFSSAVGLMNSMDAPQYFTTEALLRYGNPDMSPFARNPHYFVRPDMYYRGNMTLGVRGYLLSLFAAPFHLTSNLLYRLYNTIDFPADIVASPGFRYELSITSLFVFFSSVALLIFWQTSYEMTRNQLVSSLVTLALAFGSPIWKYSSAYTRHGFLLLLISLGIYSVWQWSQHPHVRRWYLLFLPAGG